MGFEQHLRLLFLFYSFQYSTLKRFQLWVSSQIIIRWFGWTLTQLKNIGILNEMHNFVKLNIEHLSAKIVWCLKMLQFLITLGPSFNSKNNALEEIKSIIFKCNKYSFTIHNYEIMFTYSKRMPYYNGKIQTYKCIS